MDVTENFQLPYPQCEPPLTKDASDIEQFRDLALAVDAVVQDYSDAIDERVIRPDAARLFNSAALTSTQADNVFFLNAATFDNTPGSAMSDFTNGVIRIQTTGWYFLGLWLESIVATNVSTRARFISNGSPITNFQGPSRMAEPNIAHLTIQDSAFLTAGDGITVQSRNGSPGTSVDYTARVQVQLVASV